MSIFVVQTHIRFHTPFIDGTTIMSKRGHTETAAADAVDDDDDGDDVESAPQEKRQESDSDTLYHAAIQGAPDIDTSIVDDIVEQWRARMQIDEREKTVYSAGMPSWNTGTLSRRRNGPVVDYGEDIELDGDVDALTAEEKAGQEQYDDGESASVASKPKPAPAPVPTPTPVSPSAPSSSSSYGPVQQSTLMDIVPISTRPTKPSSLRPNSEKYLQTRRRDLLMFQSECETTVRDLICLMLNTVLGYPLTARSFDPKLLRSGGKDRAGAIATSQDKLVRICQFCGIDVTTKLPIDYHRITDQPVRVQTQIVKILGSMFPRDWNDALETYAPENVTTTIYSVLDHCNLIDLDVNESRIIPGDVFKVKFGKGTLGADIQDQLTRFYAKLKLPTDDPATECVDIENVPGVDAAYSHLRSVIKPLSFYSAIVDRIPDGTVVTDEYLLEQVAVNDYPTDYNLLDRIMWYIDADQRSFTPNDIEIPDGEWAHFSYTDITMEMGRRLKDVVDIDDRLTLAHKACLHVLCKICDIDITAVTTVAYRDLAIGIPNHVMAAVIHNLDNIMGTNYGVICSARSLYKSGKGDSNAKIFMKIARDIVYQQLDVIFKYTARDGQKILEEQFANERKRELFDANLNKQIVELGKILHGCTNLETAKWICYRQIADLPREHKLAVLNLSTCPRYPEQIKRCADNIERWRHHATGLSALQWENIKAVCRSTSSPDMPTMVTTFNKNCEVLLAEGKIVDLGIVPPVIAPPIPSLPECLHGLTSKTRVKHVYQPFVRIVLARFGIAALGEVPEITTDNASCDAQIRMCEYAKRNFGAAAGPGIAQVSAEQLATDKERDDDDEFEIDEKEEEEGREEEEEEATKPTTDAVVQEMTEQLAKPEEDEEDEKVGDDEEGEGEGDDD